MNENIESKILSLGAEEARWKKFSDRWVMAAGFWVLFGGPTIGVLIYVLVQGPRITILLLWLGPAVAALAAAGFCSAGRSGARDEIKVLEMTRDSR
jgi:hypothetical protein